MGELQLLGTEPAASRLLGPGEGNSWKRTCAWCQGPEWGPLSPYLSCSPAPTSRVTCGWLTPHRLSTKSSRERVLCSLRLLPSARSGRELLLALQLLPLPCTDGAFPPAGIFIALLLRFDIR